jgi:hypothetical protein
MNWAIDFMRWLLSKKAETEECCHAGPERNIPIEEYRAAVEYNEQNGAALREKGSGK